MAKNIYIGMRYVPKLMGEHNVNTPYEALSVVTVNGSSYTSKRDVPLGIEISNTEYWVLTGNYNAQVEYYRQEVVDAKQELTAKVENSETRTNLKISELTQNVEQIPSKFPAKFYYNGESMSEESRLITIGYDSIECEYISTETPSGTTKRVSVRLPLPFNISDTNTKFVSFAHSYAPYSQIKLTNVTPFSIMFDNNTNEIVLTYNIDLGETSKTYSLYNVVISVVTFV